MNKCLIEKNPEGKNFLDLSNGASFCELLVKNMNIVDQYLHVFIFGINMQHIQKYFFHCYKNNQLLVDGGLVN